jgi:hypothetical protein
MTCGMGMMSGQLLAGDAANLSGGGLSPTVWLLIALVAAVGALFLLRRRPEPAPATSPSKRRR